MPLHNTKCTIHIYAVISTHSDIHTLIIMYHIILITSVVIIYTEHQLTTYVDNRGDARDSKVSFISSLPILHENQNQ